MTGLFLGIIAFLLNAFVLKLAIGVVGSPRAANRYSTALWVATLLNILSFVFGLIPFFGWFIYLVAWFAVIMGVYKIRVFQSLAVAILQVIFKAVVAIVLSIVGASAMGLSLAIF